MITIQNKNNVTLEGDFIAQSEFSIQAGPKAFKTLISNLYTDKVRAVLIEMSANALDSHAAAGNLDKPFEINLPTEFDSVFSIRDYGTGISPEFMLNKYTVAFFSSKETSNDYVGSKGIGRLAILSLGDSYVATSFYQGKKYVYSIFLNELGVPTCICIDVENSNEPSGFLVEIPVDNKLCPQFSYRAKSLFKYFKVKPIIKNYPDFVFDEPDYYLQAEDGSWALSGDGNPKIINSVYEYPIDIDSLSDLSETEKDILQAGLVIKTEIGEINSSANREGLDYDKITIETIKRKLNEILPKISNVLMKDFDGKYLYDKIIFKNSLFSLNGKYNKLRKFIKGIKDIPDDINFSRTTVRLFEYRWNGVNKYDSLKLEPTEGIKLVYADVTTYLKNKAKKYFENTGDRKIYFIIPDENEIDHIKTLGLDILSLPKASDMPFDSSRRPRQSKDKLTWPVFHYTYSSNRNKNWTIKTFTEEQLDDVYYITTESSLNDCHDYLDKSIRFIKKHFSVDFSVVLVTPAKADKCGLKSFEEFFNKIKNDFLKSNIAAIEKAFNLRNFGTVTSSISDLNIDNDSLAYDFVEFYKEAVGNNTEPIKEFMSIMGPGLETKLKLNKSFSCYKLKQIYPALDSFSLYSKEPEFIAILENYLNSKKKI